MFWLLLKFPSQHTIHGKSFEGENFAVFAFLYSTVDVFC